MDEQFVREWVELAARGVGLGGVMAADGKPGPSEFADRVLARLRKGAREYGDGDQNYLERPLEELFAEGGEEGDDVAGWAVAITARLYHELRHGHLGADQVQAKQGHLLRAAGYGLLAWREYDAAREA